MPATRRILSTRQPPNMQKKTVGKPAASTVAPKKRGPVEDLKKDAKRTALNEITNAVSHFIWCALGIVRSSKNWTSKKDI